MEKASYPSEEQFKMEFELGEIERAIYAKIAQTHIIRIITRLLQSGLIIKEQLLHKYRQELHANEIVLLAYYIASINIEATFSDLRDWEYEPREGIYLTDTFRLNEPHDLIGSALKP